MTAAHQSRRRSRAARALSLVTALALVAYAISDHALLGGEPGFGKTQGAIVVMGLGIAASSCLRAKWNSGVLVCFFSVAFAITTAEVTLRTFFEHRYRPAYELYEPTLFRLRPNSSREFVRGQINGGDRIIYHTNDDGFRGEPLLEKGSATRVVVYGDSFIHAEYVTLENTFAEQLEVELTSRLGRAVEVVNAGVSSFGPDQVSVKLEEELPWLEPDLVIVAIFAGNDFGDPLRNKLFRLGEDGALRRNSPELSATIRGRFQAAQGGLLVKLAIQKALLDEAPSPRGVAEAEDPELALMEACLSIAEDEYENFVVREDDLVTNLFSDYYTADVALRPQSDSARYRVRMMEGIVQRIRASAEGASTPIVFLFIPHPVDVCTEYDTIRVDHERFPEYRRTNLTDALEGIAERNELVFLNLFDPFRKLDAEGLFFRGGDDHWNEAGQQQAALLMADYLIAQGLPGAGK